MDQERFDELAKTVFETSSRRRVLGGALAGLFGATAARVADVTAKGKGKKHKKGKGKVRKQAVCLPFDCPPGSCCQDTPPGNDISCIPLGSLDGTGTCYDPGTGICHACPDGTLCDVATGSCVCSPLSCPDGCCIPAGAIGNADDLCVPNGSGEPVNTPGPFSGAFVCGTGGSFCNLCSVGTVFSGCCDATGACRAGTSNAACGSDGKLCEVCENDSSCGIDQACTGGTTTTTTSTTTAGPCGIDNCPGCCDASGTCQPGNAKSACGINGDACKACGGKRKCKGNGTCKKRKRHHHHH